MRVYIRYMCISACRCMRNLRHRPLGESLHACIFPSTCALSLSLSLLSIGLFSLQSAVIFSCRSYFRRAHPTSSPEAALHGLHSARIVSGSLLLPDRVTGFPGQQGDCRLDPLVLSSLVSRFRCPLPFPFSGNKMNIQKHTHDI